MSTQTDEGVDREELLAQADLLAEENQRLRALYRNSRRSAHRKTAAGLAGIGLVAAIGGLVFPDGREVLFTFAAIGFFGAVLTVYLTPERFVAASVGDQVYRALADNMDALVDDLALVGNPIYLPEGHPPGRLYIPSVESKDAPTAVSGPLVATEGNQGLLLDATGASLLAEVTEALVGSLAEDLSEMASQLADGAVEGLEIAEAASIDAEDTRITFVVEDPAFGDLDRFDHPIISLFACGMAVGLDRPVTPEVARGDGSNTWLVTFRLGEL